MRSMFSDRILNLDLDMLSLLGFEIFDEIIRLLECGYTNSN